MTPAQIGLVQETFKQIVPIKELAAELFYKRLFELDPKLEALFTGDMVEQGRKLMSALATVVGGLQSFERIEPTVRSLGQRHAGYGVEPEHYDTVGAALLWALEQGLGDAFTDQVKEAWTAAYLALSATMIDAARSEAA